MLRYRLALFRYSQTHNSHPLLLTNFSTGLRTNWVQVPKHTTLLLTDHLHHTSSFLQLPLSIILKTRIYVHHKHQHHFLCGSRCSLSAGASWGGTSCGWWWWCRVGGVVRIHCRAAPVRNANFKIAKMPSVVLIRLVLVSCLLKKGLISCLASRPTKSFKS